MLEVSFEPETDLLEEPPQFSLICISVGGPVTEVAWEREGEVVVDDADHSSSQIVIDPSDAVYHNVLVVSGRYGGEYTCTVSNVKTSFSTTIDIEGTYYMCIW